MSKLYTNDYNSLKRFISYYYQYSLTSKYAEKNILEIGVGNRLLSNLLKQSGFDVSTADISKELSPDFVSDVRSLPFKDNSFDTVVAFQILEHIPWSDFEKSIQQLKRVSKKWIIISLPYHSVCFELIIRFPFIRKLFKRDYFNIFFEIPLLFRKKTSSQPEHFWEIGLPKFPLKKIKTTLKKHLIINKEVRPILNHNHHFFVLEKKEG